MIYEQLKLYTTPDHYIVQPADGNKEILVIDRQTSDISATTDHSLVPTGAAPALIYGLWGVLRLPGGAGTHLLAIRSRYLVGNLWGHSVWRVEATDFLPFHHGQSHLTQQQRADAAAYLAMVQEVISTPAFYFSYTLDVTHSAQRLADTSPEFRSLSLAERADERFVWNHQLLAELRGFGRFALPIMHGFVSIWSSVYGDRAFDYALVSRRSRFRAGVRFYMRGADEFGCVANFVETEQLVQAQGQKFAYVVTRGSVPLLWSQYPNLLYKPKPVLASEAASQSGVFLAHFNDQVFTHKYGKQIVINLLDAKGVERDLCAKYAKQCAEQQAVAVPEMLRYEHFDFHRECSRMRWDRLSLLLDRTEPDYQAMGYFYIAADGAVAKQQRSVFRVNCIDCLDRTNVAQSLLARRVLLQQFRSLAWLPDDALTLSPEVERALKNIWADNADALAKQYTGTGALKADFTRTGRRTKYGAMMDGYNSLMRYAKNNFTDGFRQDAIDLFLGNYQPEPAAPSPFAAASAARGFKTRLLPGVAVMALAMLILRLLLPAAHWSETAFQCLLCITLLAISLFSIVRSGDEFVDRPKLALKIDSGRRQGKLKSS